MGAHDNGLRIAGSGVTFLARTAGHSFSRKLNVVDGHPGSTKPMSIELAESKSVIEVKRKNLLVALPGVGDAVTGNIGVLPLIRIENHLASLLATDVALVVIADDGAIGFAVDTVFDRINARRVDRPRGFEVEADVVLGHRALACVFRQNVSGRQAMLIARGGPRKGGCGHNGNREEESGNSSEKHVGSFVM